jgi:glycosyltransferase involved in cell wall biosynthesis
MIGLHPGTVKSQGQILSNFFAEAGYEVLTTSSVLNRYLRLADIVRNLITERSRIDVVILEVYGGPSFVVEDIASRLAKQFKKPLVLWLHGGALPEFMARFPNWTRRVLRRADAIISPTDYLARSVVPYGFQSHIIPNTINLAEYPYRHRTSIKPRLFWMRSFHEVWNPLMAVRVLARLRSIEPDACLVMAGPDRGLEQSARQLADGLGLNGSVRFAGFLDGPTKALEGNAADIYINTNRVDNMPVAVVEACAMGLPVVTTSVGGIKDLLQEGETGLLVPDDDDEAMVRAIRRLIKEPQLAGNLSANGRQLARRSSWDEVRPQWDRIFLQLKPHRNGTNGRS